VAANKIFHNGKIATNSKPYFIEALAVEGRKISATGKNDEILRTNSSGTELIDLGGRTVIPGLNDSHLQSAFLQLEECGGMS
jgi:predicted amidohydrolase YtcJ